MAVHGQLLVRSNIEQATGGVIGTGGKRESVREELQKKRIRLSVLAAAWTTPHSPSRRLCHSRVPGTSVCTGRRECPTAWPKRHRHRSQRTGLAATATGPSHLRCGRGMRKPVVPSRCPTDHRTCLLSWSRSARERGGSGRSTFTWALHQLT